MAIGTGPKRELDRLSACPAFLANGFFVAAEFAYITARRNVLEQIHGGPPRSQLAEQEPDSEPRRRPTRHHHGFIGAGRRGEPAVATIFELGLGFLASRRT